MHVNYVEYTKVTTSTRYSQKLKLIKKNFVTLQLGQGQNNVSALFVSSKEDESSQTDPTDTRDKTCKQSGHIQEEGGEEKEEQGEKVMSITRVHKNRRLE